MVTVDGLIKAGGVASGFVSGFVAPIIATKMYSMSFKGSIQPQNVRIMHSFASCISAVAGIDFPSVVIGSLGSTSLMTAGFVLFPQFSTALVRENEGSILGLGTLAGLLTASSAYCVATSVLEIEHPMGKAVLAIASQGITQVVSKAVASSVLEKIVNSANLAKSKVSTQQQRKAVSKSPAGKVAGRRRRNRRHKITNSHAIR